MTHAPLHIQTPRGDGRDGLSGAEVMMGSVLERRSGVAVERVRPAWLTVNGVCHQSLRCQRASASGRMLTPAMAKQRGRGAFLVEVRGFHEQE